MAGQPQRFSYRGLYRLDRVPSCVLSHEDLQRLFKDLDKKATEALERYLSSLTQPPNLDSMQFEELKRNLRESGGVTVSILGRNGEQIVSQSQDALSSENLPDHVNQIRFDSAFALRRFDIVPINRFTLILDFTEPPGFHAYNPADDPTPNKSQLEVMGDDESWVTGVSEGILAFFKGKRGRRIAWIHSRNTFNIATWLVGIPAALWYTYRIDSAFLKVFLTDQTALRTAANVYIFFVSFLAFRLIVHGFRWIFPLVELEGARSKKVRAGIGLILSSLVLALLYDVLRAIVLGQTVD